MSKHAEGEELFLPLKLSSARPEHRAVTPRRARRLNRLSKQGLPETSAAQLELHSTPLNEAAHAEKPKTTSDNLRNIERDEPELPAGAEWGKRGKK